MDLDRFRSTLRDHLALEAAELGLDAARLRVEYVLNWGGFVNRSFHVTDGHARLHLKLACEPEIQGALRRFWELRGMMAERYHAPAAVAWIEVPGTDYAGILSRWIEGAPPGALDERLAAEIVAVVARLHADRELAARLPSPPTPATCADVYLRTYDERFAADLDYVDGERPPFVSPETAEWMRAEAKALQGAVRAAPAFARAADAPTHGDLWLDNLLVTPAGEWYVLDWDDLAPGDPALDWGMLFGPARGDLRTAMDRALPPALAADAAVRERLALYARASLLDWIIDPLSDWIAATEAPEHIGEVRAEKERIHRAALAAYRARYPHPPKG
ncbi:MAG TPA: phosphotransferase [Longimicrobium sp.]|nr:phosphotransferase [Longimicrobium sp.]